MYEYLLKFPLVPLVVEGNNVVEFVVVVVLVPGYIVQPLGLKGVDHGSDAQVVAGFGEDKVQLIVVTVP